MIDPPAPVEPRAPRWADLSYRQAQVAELLARGASTEDAAQAIGISLGTALSHRAAALRKLGLTNNAQLALLAVAEGVVEVDRRRMVSTDLLRAEIRDAFSAALTAAGRPPGEALTSAEEFAGARLRALLP